MLKRCGLAFALGLTVACSQAAEPIVVRDNTIHVQNQTGRDWRNVVVTVNDHFRGGAPLLAAGGRLTAPLSQFQTAYGQRYDFDRQTVFKVEVTATDSNGEPVKLEKGPGGKP
jgi:hypothetical protein